MIFSTPVFTKGERPEGGQGNAAFWLPLLALFTGARLSELAGLKAPDVAHEELIGTHCLYIVPDVKAGRRLKNKHSARAVPIHQQLFAVGFLDFVAAQRKTRGEEGWLLPEVSPDTTGASAFSKWFGRFACRRLPISLLYSSVEQRGVEASMPISPPRGQAQPWEHAMQTRWTKHVLSIFAGRISIGPPST